MGRFDQNGKKRLKLKAGFETAFEKKLTAKMNTCNHAFLIDDDEMTNMINAQVIHLSQFATKVSTFNSAGEALANLIEIEKSEMNQFPAFIFLDIAMPGMDGWEFLDVLIKLPESILQKCNVVMVTSSINLFDIKKAKRYSVVKDYIIKPMDSKMLTALSSVKHEHFSISQSAVNAI